MDEVANKTPCEGKIETAQNVLVRRVSSIRQCANRRPPSWNGDRFTANQGLVFLNDHTPKEAHLKVAKGNVVQSHPKLPSDGRTRIGTLCGDDSMF